jgi:tripartite-type tricarboxylate transporter receptor subunit TctC
VYQFAPRRFHPHERRQQSAGAPHDNEEIMAAQQSIFRGIALAVPALFASLAWPQANYPQRPVRMVVPFAPGGASDFVARILQAKMSEELGQQLVIDNRTGAAGNIGVEVAARASPDGYTALLGNIGTMAINPGLYLKFPVKPVDDLIAITQVVDVPGSLVVHPSLPVKDVKELIDYAKANQGKLNFGSPGTGSANQLEMESFMRATGIRMTHNTYKGGAGPAAIALLGNEVQLMFVTLSSSITFVKQGRLRALGIVAKARCGDCRCADDGRSGISGHDGRLMAGCIRAEGGAERCGQKTLCGNDQGNGRCKCEEATGGWRRRCRRE